MKRTLLTVAVAASLIAAATNNAQARIGWTLEQCKAAYGEGVAVWGGQYHNFQVGDFKIRVQIYDGKVIKIDYTKPGEDPTPEFTPDEAQTILLKNSGGIAWKHDPANPDDVSISYVDATWAEGGPKTKMVNRTSYFVPVKPFLGTDFIWATVETQETNDERLVKSIYIMNDDGSERLGSAERGAEKKAAEAEKKAEDEAKTKDLDKL